MKRALWMLGLSLWAVMSVAGVGALMVAHTAAMPGPVNRQATDAGLLRLVGAPSSVVHVIPATCSCTDGLVRHLLSRGARADVDEHVVFVGVPSPLHRSVQGAGYVLHTWEPAALKERLGLTAGPVLAVRRAGQLQYLGGYFQFPAAVRSLDVSRIDGALAGQAPATLPLFGCAVDPVLADRVDPLGLTQ